MKNIELYEKNILANHNSNTLNRTKCDNCIVLSKSLDGCELTLSINPISNIIENATINNCENDKYKQGMMYAFCKIISGMPILEANDHAVIRLENLLRDKHVAHPIQGVIMPTNSCELFRIPLNLIRAIYDQYSNTQNYHPLVNTYRPYAIKKWKKLNIQERENIVDQKIKLFSKKHNIEEYTAKLIGDMRVEFVADKEIYNSSLSQLLFDLEVYLSNELGFSLEIMYTEQKDANKKRQN